MSITLNGQDITSTLSTKQDILNSTSNIEVLSINLDGDDLSELLDSKQNNLSINSHVNLGSLTVTSDTLVVSTGTPGEIICESIILNGENITETMASYAGTATAFTSGQIVKTAHYELLAVTDQASWILYTGDTTEKIMVLELVDMPYDDVYVDITFYAQGIKLTDETASSIEFRMRVSEKPENTSDYTETYSNKKTGVLGYLFPFTYRYIPFTRTDYSTREGIYVAGYMTNNSSSTIKMNINSGYFFYKVSYIKI